MSGQSSASPSTLFCCRAIEPCRPFCQREGGQFALLAFMKWGMYPKVPARPNAETSTQDVDSLFAVSFVRHANFGPLEVKRYYIPSRDEDDEEEFEEVTEAELTQSKFQKSYA